MLLLFDMWFPSVREPVGLRAPPAAGRTPTVRHPDAHRPQRPGNRPV